MSSTVPQLRSDRKLYDIAIAGAGFSGLGLAIHLKKQGKYSFVVLERNAEVGGTWHDNTYPGAACDIPTFLYSYSFEPWPHWSNNYGPQQEILEYIKHCADKYGLRPHIRFRRNIQQVWYDEANCIWHTRLANGETILSRIVVGCTGPLNKANFPNIPGRETFQGAAFHTARWDHAVDLTGKRVGVIGTGASAIQVIPSIAEKVGHLSVFQRTPPWVIKRHDHPIKPGVQKLYKALPFLQKIRRGRVYLRQEAAALAFVVFPKLMNVARRLGVRNLQKGIQDPELREKLTPNFMMGCKRVLLSNTYYPSLTRENVALVTDSIEEITPTGVRTTDGKLHELDVLVYATGFEASENMAPFEVLGKNGVDLQDLWKNGGESFLGTTVNGFPNFFMIVGPNTGLGHNSMIYMIESQVRYIMHALKVMDRKGFKEVEVKASVQDAFNEKVQKRLEGTIWNHGGCMSWYLNHDGKNTTLWPGFTFEYRHKTRRFKVKDYEVK